jgi:LPS export ABC transporter protein LptC
MPPRKITGMRNHDAARYARWSAGVALAICFLVLGVYLHRQMRDRAHEKKFAPVPATVAQQSAGFTVSRAIGPRTIFTVHASQATQFKDQNRSLLENVDITIFGPRGDRNDSVHAGECSYDPTTGDIHCQGAVQIDLRGAKSDAAGNLSQKDSLHLDTSDILFSHGTEKVTTDKPVALKFSGGEGKGVGLVYDTQTENATLEENVQLGLFPPKKSNADPIRVASSAMELLRTENVLRFSGPVRVQQNSTTLSSGLLELQLNGAMQPVRALATENPVILSSGPRGKVSFAANQIAADLLQNEQVQKISADENVRGNLAGRDGEDHFSAQHAQIIMASTSTGSAPREILAQGNVEAETNQGKRRGNLATESLRVELSPAEKGGGENISSAETFAPGEITMTEPNETDQLQGGKLKANFGAQNQLTELHGGSGVHLERMQSAAPPETSSAENMLTKFGPDGNWETIDESGNVKFRQGEKSGVANAAQLVRATNELVLTGSASVEDSSSRLQAAKIRMNQTTNEIHASGRVAASFSGQTQKSGFNPSARVAQISSDEMDGTSSSKSSDAPGHAIFSGHARFWQSPDVLQAQTIEFWQDEKRAEARGNVLGAFVEAPHNDKSNGTADGKQPAKKTAPVLWQVRAPKVDYWSDSGKMKWSDGVEAHSSEGAIESRTVEMFFSRGENSQQMLERAIGIGNVRIEQDGRTGTAERGEYFARDGKFILSGGKPTLTDNSGNTTTGHELTFFLANDSVLVDSHEEKSIGATFP